MTAERGGHSSGDGSSARDTGTQTFKAVILVAVVAVVGILVLKNTGPGSKPINSTSPTTTLPALGAPAPTVTTPTTSPTTTTPPTTAPLNPASVKVLVLNGTTTSGAATYFTNKLHGAGYNTLAPSNATGRSVSTTMVYVNKPGSSAAGVAHTLGLAPSSIANSVPPNVPVPAALLQQDNPNVLVVIGTDISSQATSGSSSSSTTTTPSTTGTTRPASPSTT